MPLSRTFILLFHPWHPWKTWSVHSFGSMKTNVCMSIQWHGNLQLIYLLILIYFIDYDITDVLFPPLYSPLPCTPPPTHITPFSSCPWVIYISSLWLASNWSYMTEVVERPCYESYSHTEVNFVNNLSEVKKWGSYPPPVYFLSTIYATYSLYLSPLSTPPNTLLITLHMISISVVLFLF